MRQQLITFSCNLLSQRAPPLKTIFGKVIFQLSREELLISLLKSKQSIAELRRSKDNNAEIEETKKIFNELRNRFSKEKIKRIRRKFRYREKLASI